MEWIQRGWGARHCDSNSNGQNREKQPMDFRIRREHPPKGDPPVGEVPQGARAYGLCASCAHRDTCLNQKVEGGVWRCPDYA